MGRLKLPGQTVSQRKLLVLGKHAPSVSLHLQVRSIIELCDGFDDLLQFRPRRPQQPNFFTMHGHMKMDPPRIRIAEDQRRIGTEFGGQVGEAMDFPFADFANV